MLVLLVSQNTICRRSRSPGTESPSPTTHQASQNSISLLLHNVLNLRIDNAYPVFPACLEGKALALSPSSCIVGMQQKSQFRNTCTHMWGTWECGIQNSRHHYRRYRILPLSSQQVWVTAEPQAAHTCGDCQRLGSLAAVVSGEVEALCVQLDLGGWVDLIARQISFDSNGRSNNLIACRRVRQAAQKQCQRLLELPAHRFQLAAHKIGLQRGQCMQG